MKLVDRQIIRELIGPFFFGVTAFSSIFFAGTYLLKLTNWVMNGMPLMMAGKIVLLLLPSIVVFTLPMSTLLSVLLGIGRLSGDSEVVALFAGGISIYRLVIPIAIMGIIVSGSSIILNEMIAPQAWAQYQEIQASVLQQTAPKDQPFTVKDDGTNSLILVKGGMNVDTGILRNVTVTQFSGNIPFLVIYAERAQWAGLTDKTKTYHWRLYNGWSQLVGNDSPAFESFGQANTKDIVIDKTPGQFSLYQKSNLKNSDQLSYSELTALVKYLRVHPDRPIDKILELEVNRWNRFALPMSSFIFALLATPLGIRPHRSASSVGFGLSILLIFIYWMVWHYTSSLAVQGNLSPLIGAFLADIMGIAAAIALLKNVAK